CALARATRPSISTTRFAPRVRTPRATMSKTKPTLIPPLYVLRQSGRKAEPLVHLLLFSLRIENLGCLHRVLCLAPSAFWDQRAAELCQEARVDAWVERDLRTYRSPCFINQSRQAFIPTGLIWKIALSVSFASRVSSLSVEGRSYGSKYRSES